MAGLHKAGLHKKKPATLTAGRPTAFTGRKWVRWTKDMKARFLDHLAATCNVTASAAEIGVAVISVYALRRRDPAFLEEWGKALAAGYEMLETQLVAHAMGQRGGDGAADASGAPTLGEAVGEAPGQEARVLSTGANGPIDVDLALRLLVYHRNAMPSPVRPNSRQPQRALPEDTNAALLKKLEAMEKRRETA